MPTIYNSIPIPNNMWSWSIISKMGDMLDKAESKYGVRDKSYTILGVELTPVGNPYIWYRGENEKQVIIRISKRCKNDMDFAVFQVSQEIIHCLSPAVGQTANVLEEGLATHFANEYYKSCGYKKWSIDKKRYIDALELVNKLFLIDSDIIKKLRQIEPTISKISKDLILATNSKIPSDLAESLADIFK
jgi:hypothetical protein